MLCYRIANTIVSIQSATKYMTDRLEPFLTDETDNADLTADINLIEEVPVPEGERISDEMSMVWIRKNSEAGGYFAYLISPENRPAAAVEADVSWTKCRGYCEENIISSDSDLCPSEMLTFQFLGIAFRNRIIFNNSIVLHASCIEHQGRGIAFTAPSGTGKSTHTRLWEQYKAGTQVLNDDAPVIRITDGKPVLYGTPWSGSSNKYLNLSVPLNAIVLLEQAEENSIRRLSTAESVAAIMPRMLLPYHDNKMMHLALSTFDKITASTPVYKLECRPDAEAVEMVYQCIIS